MEDSRPLVEILAATDVVLYDFDGPLCDVFAGKSADTVARQLEAMVGSSFDTDDPLEILRHVQGSVDLNSVEDALVTAEIDAVGLSERTPGGLESVHAAFVAGKRVGIVSNNAGAAVERFLSRAGVAGQVWPVVGRAYAMPSRMKPHPWPLASALAALDVEPNAAVFVGDSATDVEAANLAGLPCIAYANKPGKREMFEPAAAFVIDSMWELAEALTAASGSTPVE